MDKRNKPFYLHKGFQLIFTVVILAIFTLKTYDSLRYINIEESWPQYFSNLPDKHIQFGHGVTTVDAGMYVKNFFKFDIEQGDFEIEADVWFLFNPNLISLETISKFQFEHGYIIQKSSPITKMIGTDLFSVFQVRASFTSELLHRRFPFNDHRIFLTLKLVEILPEEMQFEVRQAGLRIADNVIPQGWQAKSFLAEAGYLKEVIHQQDDR